MDIYKIVETQERETPGVLPREKYAEYFSKSVWGKAVKLVKKEKPAVLYRVARWLVGRWQNVTAVLILDREGKPHTGDCANRYSFYRAAECPKYLAALAILWADEKGKFQVRVTRKSKDELLWNLEPGALPNPETLLSTREEIVRRNAQVLSSFRVAEIRSVAKGLGLKLGSGNKASLVGRFARYLASPTFIREMVEKLSPEERSVLAARDIFRGYSETWRDMRRRLYDTFGHKTHWDAAESSLLDKGWGIYEGLGYRLIDLAPDEALDLLSVPTAEVLEPPSISRALWEYPYDLYRLLSILDTGEYRGEPTVLPEGLPPNLVDQYSSIWHPEWSILPLDTGLYPVYFRGVRFSDRQHAVVARKLGVSEAYLSTLLYVLETLSLVSIKESVYRVEQSNLQKFARWPQYRQILFATKPFLDLVGIAAAEAVSMKHNFRLMKLRGEQSHSSLEFPMMLYLVFDVLEALCLLPRRKWMAWDSIVKMAEVWADISVAKRAVYMLSTDPMEEWGEFFLKWLQELLMLLAYAGTVDLIVRDGKIAFVRVTYLPRMRSHLDEPMEIPSGAIPLEGGIKAFPQKVSSITLHLPIEIPPQVLDILNDLGFELRIKSGEWWAQGKLDSLKECFRRGEKPDTLRNRWEEAAGMPLPPEFERWIEQAYESYGKVRLYPKVTLVRFKDEPTRRHMTAAVPALRAHRSVVEVTPTDVLMDSESTGMLLESLRKSGYVPKVVKLSGSGENA